MGSLHRDSCGNRHIEVERLLANKELMFVGTMPREYDLPLLPDDHKVLDSSNYLIMMVYIETSLSFNECYIWVESLCLYDMKQAVMIMGRVASSTHKAFSTVEENCRYMEKYHNGCNRFIRVS